MLPNFYSPLSSTIEEQRNCLQTTKPLPRLPASPLSIKLHGSSSMAGILVAESLIKIDINCWLCGVFHLMAALSEMHRAILIIWSHQGRMRKSDLQSLWQNDVLDIPHSLLQSSQCCLSCTCESPANWARWWNSPRPLSWPFPQGGKSLPPQVAWSLVLFF